MVKLFYKVNRSVDRSGEMETIIKFYYYELYTQESFKCKNFPYMRKFWNQSQSMRGAEKLLNHWLPYAAMLALLVFYCLDVVSMIAQLARAG